MYSFLLFQSIFCGFSHIRYSSSACTRILISLILLLLNVVDFGSGKLDYFEMFAIGKSMVCFAVRDLICIVNIELRSEISWPRGNSLLTTMAKFQEWCGLPGLVYAIDGMHFYIKKPSMMPKDYFYSIIGDYSIQYQVVCDKNKRFLDIHLECLEVLTILGC